MTFYLNLQFSELYVPDSIPNPVHCELIFMALLRKKEENPRRFCRV